MQRYILVHGRVQGVNFRYFAQQNAERLSIQGYVKNLPDGGVEIVAEGDEATLNRFVTILWKCPPAAKVDAVKVEERSFGEEYTSFRIEY
jgi:acylphosphatase